ncbi:hypothetical protein O1611_g5973 [Lasiodiplodia mahajangana]|uniref:Uncharacterized protein n=1 Tax=Lasiodiplodia mahajangana TaxID=1108764 RepID=A0ACC2JK48_9PEZI|nr:hypothetical protein O1611_g5973 [Lasiodiplodia mahajangana]
MAIIDQDNFSNISWQIEADDGAEAARESASPVELEKGRGLEVRVPIVRPRFMADGRDGDGCGMSRGRTGERVGFQREQTLASLYTTSDTPTTVAHDSAGGDARDEIGIAR